MLQRWRGWQELYVLGFGVLILVISCLMYLGHLSVLPLVFQRMEALSYDVRMRLIPQQALDTLPQILIVDIDEASLQSEGQWPWSRYKLANLIERLHQAGAAVIAMDMSFPEPELHPLDAIKQRLPTSTQLDPSLLAYYQQLDGDEQLAKVFKDSQVILGNLFHQMDHFQKGSLQPIRIDWQAKSQQLPTSLVMQGVTANLPKLSAAAAGTGFLNIFPDDDGVIRSAPLILEYQQQFYPSLALQTVRQYLLDEQPIKLSTEIIAKAEVITQLEYAGKTVGTDPTGQIIIPFLGTAGRFETFAATDILRKPVPTQFADAIVLIGTSAKGLADLRSTPFQPAFPGVEAQATLVYALLHPSIIPITPEWLDAAVILEMLILGIAMLCLYPHLQPYAMLVFGVLLSVLVISLNLWLWMYERLNTPLLPSLLLVAAMSFFFFLERLLTEHQQRQRIQDMFGQYVPSEHIDQLLSNPQLNANMESERRQMTVLFSDIRQFTPIVEKLPSTQVQNFLNAYLTPLTSIIFQHQGTVDKYVGDMIMAFWGAPLPDQAHAEHAVLAALSMQTTLQTIQPQFEDLGIREVVRAGIGIHSGEMTVGDMGSRYRRAYTVLGDAVNLASRLQELTKYYQIETLVSDETVKQCSTVQFRLLDQVRVRGRSEPVLIYQPLGLKSAWTNEAIYLARHEEAIQAYLAGNWGLARTVVEALNLHQPSHYYALILQRLQAHAYQAPADWNGVIHLEEL